tara:strand:+ start:146 stop:544 length:399 start_codon:yes stop_codon:yes gene_type:complete
MDLEILNIASNTDNNRNIKSRTHYSKLKNSLCGDEIKIDLIIIDNKIIDFGYNGESCIYCQASASLLSKISINKNKIEIKELCNNIELYFNNNSKLVEKKWKSLNILFKIKNKHRKECILLPFKAFNKIKSV